jgi:CRP-like cAMP-binding protein
LTKPARTSSSYSLDDQVPYLLRLDDVSRKEALSLGVELNYPARSVVMREGEPSTHVLLVRQGWLKVTALSINGHEALLALRGPGDIVGESAALDGTSRTVTVTTLEPVLARNVPADAFSRFLDNRPHAMRQLLALTTDRWRSSDRQRLEQAATTVRQRLARLLLELADIHGSQEAAGVVIRVPLTQQELAGSVGSSREAVTRLLKEFREKGWVRSNARQYVVLRADVLRRICTTGGGELLDR